MTPSARSRRPLLFSTRRFGVLAAVALLGGWGGTARAQLVPLVTATPTPQPRGFFLFRAPQRPVVQAIPQQEGRRSHNP